MNDAPQNSAGEKKSGPGSLRVGVVAAIVGLALGGCTLMPPPPRSAPQESTDSAIYHRADRDRTELLEREVGRLRADLRHAEESMVAIESGLRSTRSRADAVSAIAETRIDVERAANAVPWRGDRVAEARGKLAEAERQLLAGHTGSAVFFASRAGRIAETLAEEARLVAEAPSIRIVNRSRVNLRSGPSTSHAVLEVLRGSAPVFAERRAEKWMLVRTLAGRVGWVHISLLSRRDQTSSDATTQSLPSSLAR